MNQMHFQKPPLTKVNKILIITAVTLFILSSASSMMGIPSIGGLLRLSANGFTRGFIFQLITYPLIQHSFISVLFNCLLLWFIGGELELKWGRKTYLKFLLISSIGAGIVFLLSTYFLGNPNVSLMGLDGINLSLLIAYGVIYSDRTMSFMLIFPMQAKYFCFLLAGIQIYMGIFSTQKFHAWAHITAMIWGYLFLKGKSLSIKKRQKPRNKGHLKLVEDENEKEPRYWQ